MKRINGSDEIGPKVRNATPAAVAQATRHA
jgi:hypothetical protein